MYFSYIWVQFEHSCPFVTLITFYFTFSHLADAFIQSDLQIRKSN